MSRVTACLILLSGSLSLNAAEWEPPFVTEGLTSGSPVTNQHQTSSELLETVFEDGKPVPVMAMDPGGTICYEDSCRRCACRTWTARIGFLAWRPELDSTAGGGGGIGFGDLDYDTGYGPYVDLIYHTGSADLEFIYFSVYDWSSGTSIAPVLSFTSEAELANYELNIKTEVIRNVRLLTGIRVVELETAGQLVIPAGPGAIDITADNELIGWQFGVETDWYRRGPFSIDTIWKGGIYHNDIEVGEGIPAGPMITLEQGDTSFLTDFWFNLNYQLSDNVALRGGYSLMYIDPVATLGDLDDDIFIHGLHAMLEVGI
jgi:hypothetical protein